MVGSMPAFASFFRGEMPGASWLASLNSLVAVSRSLTSRSKVGLSHKSSKVVPSSEERMVPSGRARDKGYLEIYDTLQVKGYELGSVRTEICGYSATPRTIEHGVVHKTTDVHQMVRQERQAA